MSRLERILAGAEPMAVENDHFAYSPVFRAEAGATHLAVVSSVDPVDFADMVAYFTQADPFEDFLTEEGLERTESPLTEIQVEVR